MSDVAHAAKVAQEGPFARPDHDGHGPGSRTPTGKALALLSLSALGVVYGDLGTSPLYSLKECFGGTHSVPPTPENILGVLSLVFWTLNFVVSFKYIGFVMRADNRGEGGILALMALVRPKATPLGGRSLLLMAGLFGSALLYGDGIITPAISVLGAVEGISVATPALEHVVVWVAVAILIALFSFQKRGTAGVGRVFGPIMVLWFITIALLGIRGILMHPAVLAAANPYHAFNFFVRDGVQGFLVLGGVVLVVTGGEALYADMGHFGKRPIRAAWFVVALPALVLNYFGQSANLLVHPEAAQNPFYALVPAWALYPVIVIATLAAIVASQALISGAFSLTRQAVQLGYSPRVTIVHTSSTEMGQIYIPEVNQALGVACVALVLGFKSAGNLAAAYGIAVTGTMMITTLLFHRVARERWQWSWWRANLLTGLFLTVDLAFFLANVVKIEEGGWFPIVVALAVFTMMTTWKRGREIVQRINHANTLPLDLFLGDIRKRKPPRVPGTAVFLTSDPTGAPPVLLHHLKHNKVLHERVILLSIMTEEIPQVPAADRIECRELGEGFYQVKAHSGFMETPDVPALLRAAGMAGVRGGPIPTKAMETSFFLGRETLIPSGDSRLARWRKRLFIVMSRNARSAASFFNLPANRVVELGAQIQF
ncbi:MAG TPA: potassium transporter Kup [Gemmatimonadales bacterium]|nr:potassium transporter Kup [Gemmatimonadales bacterium]